MNENKETIALVAHDEKKDEMVEWTQKNEKVLKDYRLVGTDGTAEKINRLTNLRVEDIGHGPQGGDLIIASEILRENIDILIFFIDTSTSHAHEHDIQSLRRTAIDSIIYAANPQTANRIICSSE